MAEAQADWRLIPLKSVWTSPRVRCCFGHMTLGELDDMSDEEMLKRPGFGRKSVTELRRTIERHRKQDDLPPSVNAWVWRHRILIEALMAGEAVIVPLVASSQSDRLIGLKRVLAGQEG